MPTWYINSVLFLFGALIGSFLNVVGLRFLKGESIVWPGSHCTTCQQTIAPYDNIPILSWLVLGGRCRKCRSPISAQYPLVELSTALLFLWIGQQYGMTLQTCFLLFLACNLVVVCITDFREHYIFDINSLGLIPFGLIYSFLNLGQWGIHMTYSLFGHSITFAESFLSAIIAIMGAFIIFFLLNLFSRLVVGKPGFGEGDTRLLMGFGAFFGVQWMVLIFVLGFIIQVAFGLPMVFWQWFRAKAYGPIVWFISAVVVALIPYPLQAHLQNGLGLLIATLGCAVLALVCAFKAIRLAQNCPVGLTYLPFGPALVGGCFIMVFYSETVMRLVNVWLQK